MKLVDTHCHLDREEYEDLDDVIQDSKAHLEFVVNVGCSVASSDACRALAEQHEFIYFTAGIHPNYSNEFDENSIQKLTNILKSKKAVAVGEIGLDYYRDFVTKEKQKESFREQLALAKDLSLPVVIHGREAYADIIKILSEASFKDVEVVMHSYAGSYEEIKYILDRAYISFSGVVTFKNAQIVQETASKVPVERILIETDSPYLSPHPHRGKKNYPKNVEYVLKAIASLRGEDPGSLAEITTNNAKQVFKI